MAEFRYDKYSSPYIGQISELLRAPGDAYARAAEVGGNAQASAALQRGAAWGNAAQNIGQSIAAIPSQIQQAKAQQQNTAIRSQQLEAGALQVGEQKRAISARDAFAKIIKDTPQLNEDGVSLYDIPAVAQQLAASGQDPAIAVEHLGKLNDAFRAEKAAKLSLVKTGAASVAAAGNDPVLANHFLDQLERNGTYPKEQVKQFRDIIDADPANVAKLTAYLMGPQKMERGAPGSVAVNPLTGIPVPGSAVPDPKAETAAKQAAERQTEIARHNAETERIAGLNAGKAEAAQKETERHNRAMEAQGEAAPSLSPEARDLTAKQFAMTGQLPPMGMGKAGAAVRTSIINRAAELYKDLDLPTQVAAFNANKESLKKLQVSRDAIGAFEQTALKNIDVFLDVAGKVVDTGSPLANKLLRNVSSSVLGSPNQAAFDAARQVAVNEIAKITSNPNLTGTLSDSARKEVEAFNPQSATLAQSVAVMRLLKNDMKNRTGSMDEEIKAIQQRIATPPGSATTTPAANTAGATYRLVNGQWVKQ